MNGSEKWAAAAKPKPKRSRARRRGFAAGLAVAILTASLGAYALWVTNGSGSVGTHTGSLTAVIVTANGASGEALLPGGSARAFADFQNDNSTSVKLTALTQSGNGSGCTLGAGDVTFTAQGLPITVAPGATAHVDVGSVSAASSLSNTCQNVAVSIPVATTTTVGT